MEILHLFNVNYKSFHVLLPALSVSKRAIASSTLSCSSSVGVTCENVGESLGDSSELLASSVNFFSSCDALVQDLLAVNSK